LQCKNHLIYQVVLVCLWSENCAFHSE